MRYLGTITDSKDLTTKEYVDNEVDTKVDINQGAANNGKAMIVSGGNLTPTVIDAIATSGNVNDLKQTSGDTLILNCGGAAST